ncbi:helix-turn-helix transcriptional regulator [Aureliella helgolandensis]|nr:helix-turn-helix domain-containing protein [Aureliella helgolandensis]
MFYRTTELMKLFEVTSNTIRRWAREGTMPAQFMRGRWLKSDVDAWLARKPTNANEHFQTTERQQGEH